MAPLVLICLCLSSHFSPAAHEAQGLSQDFFLCPWGVGRPLKGLGHATIVTAHFLSETSSSATSYSSEFSKRLLSTYICESPAPAPARTHPGSLPSLRAVHLFLVPSWLVPVQDPGL